MPPKAAKMSCWLLCLCNEFILDGQFLNSCGSTARFHLKHTVTQHYFNRSLLDSFPWPSCLSSKAYYQMLIHPKPYIWWCQHTHVWAWGRPGGTHPAHACSLPISDTLGKRKCPQRRSLTPHTQLGTEFNNHLMHCFVKKRPQTH